jgi:hypothetical protein
MLFMVIERLRNHERRRGLSPLSGEGPHVAQGIENPAARPGRFPQLGSAAMGVFSKNPMK